VAQRQDEVVEDCLQLDANRWVREGYLRAGVRALGSWRWTYRGGGGFTVNYKVDAGEEGCGPVRLCYSSVLRRTGQQESLNYRVGLTATRPRFGGLRWWLLCPLVVRARPCERCVGKLYLPPAARYFGWRRCHDLTCRSCQEDDSRVSALRRNPALLNAILNNLKGASPGQLIVALKAIG
jgi:hypothetical protein